MIPERIIETALKNSFKNFHAKGLDYICTKRTEGGTVKFYFFDGDVSKLPEVVNPHDHRYDFHTKVLSGALFDYRYRTCRPGEGQAVTAWAWRTPLNNGDGFSEPYQAFLRRMMPIKLVADSSYFTPAEVIHTIRPASDRTVIQLVQHRDKLSLEDYTTTYVHEDKPSLDGLYERFTEAEIVERLKVIRDLNYGFLV